MFASGGASLVYSSDHGGEVRSVLGTDSFINFFYLINNAKKLTRHSAAIKDKYKTLPADRIGEGYQ